MICPSCEHREGKLTLAFKTFINNLFAARKQYYIRIINESNAIISNT